MNVSLFQWLYSSMPDEIVFDKKKYKLKKKKEKNAIIVIKVSILGAMLKALFIFQWLMFIRGQGTSQVSGGKDSASRAAPASRPQRVSGPRG